MRVIAGVAKGHKLKAREGILVRPTTDRVKEGMFNIIQGNLPCGMVLDLFGGSGALGVEALSRGAQSCIFIECDRKNIKVINDNLTHTKLFDKAQVICGDALAYLRATSYKFDIIFLDPPYNKGYLKQVFEMFRVYHVLSDGGIVAVESRLDGEELEFTGFECVRRRKYGDTVVSVYKEERTIQDEDCSISGKL